MQNSLSFKLINPYPQVDEVGHTTDRCIKERSACIWYFLTFWSGTPIALQLSLSLTLVKRYLYGCGWASKVKRCRNMSTWWFFNPVLQSPINWWEISLSEDHPYPHLWNSQERRSKTVTTDKTSSFLCASDITKRLTSCMILQITFQAPAVKYYSIHTQGQSSY